jgi:hypothetical protein
VSIGTDSFKGGGREGLGRGSSGEPRRSSRRAGERENGAGGAGVGEEKREDGTGGAEEKPRKRERGQAGGVGEDKDKVFFKGTPGQPRNPTHKFLF